MNKAAIAAVCLALPLATAWDLAVPKAAQATSILPTAQLAVTVTPNTALTSVYLLYFQNNGSTSFGSALLSNSIAANTTFSQNVNLTNVSSPGTWGYAVAGVYGNGVVAITGNSSYVTNSLDFPNVFSGTTEAAFATALTNGNNSALFAFALNSSNSSTIQGNSSFTVGAASGGGYQITGTSGASPLVKFTQATNGGIVNATNGAVVAPEVGTLALLASAASLGVGALVAKRRRAAA